LPRVRWSCTKLLGAGPPAERIPVPFFLIGDKLGVSVFVLANTANRYVKAKARFST
jgi:hypothetical protein